MNLNERRDQFRRMLSSILEERVYITFASELGMVCDGDLAAMTSETLSSLVKAATPDEFRGHAPAMMIVDEPLRKLPPDVAAMVFDAHVIHEAGHIVTTHHVGDDVPENGLKELVATPFKTWPAYAIQPAWSTHDLRFIRAMIHVAHRTESRGHRIAMNVAFQNQRYRLSPISAYLTALGDEPRKTNWLPIREALAKPMPEPFVKLWAQDVLKSLSN